MPYHHNQCNNLSQVRACKVKRASHVGQVDISGCSRLVSISSSVRSLASRVHQHLGCNNAWTQVFLREGRHIGSNVILQAVIAVPVAIGNVPVAKCGLKLSFVTIVTY